MSAGLLASTVTPGSTAPLASLTVPAILPAPVCAKRTVGMKRTDAASDIQALNILTNQSSVCRASSRRAGDHASTLSGCLPKSYSEYGIRGQQSTQTDAVTADRRCNV